MPHRLPMYAISVSLAVMLAACTPAATSVDQQPTPTAGEQQQNAMALADSMRRSGNLAGAARIYQELAAREDGETTAHIALANIYRKTGNVEGAVAVMREAEKRKPADENVLAGLGYALIAAKDYKEAVDIFDRLTAINHESAIGYNGKAVAFDHAGNHIAAQEIYQKALSLEPGSITIQNNLALSLILDNKPGTAISILEPLAGQSNATPTIRHNLALAYGIKGDMKRAHALNRQDMNDAQADENQFFYEQYATMLKQQQREALTPKMKATLPSAMDVDDDDTEPVELAPAAAALKPVKPLVAKSVNPAAAPAPTIPRDVVTEAMDPTPVKDDGKFWGYDATYSYPKPR